MNSKDQTIEEKLNNILDSLKRITELLEGLIKTYPPLLPTPTPAPKPGQPKKPFRGNDPVGPWTTDKTLPWDLRNRKAQKCLHEGCPECQGSGIKRNGEICVHGISCPCPKCSPISM